MPNVFAQLGCTRLVSFQLLASASGAQVAIARTVGIAEVPTAMLSSPIVDFVVDPHLLHLLPVRRAGESRWQALRRHANAPEHKARNRRGIYIASIVTGSFVGAIVHRVAGEQIVLLVGVVVKVVITVGFAVAPCVGDGGERSGAGSQESVKRLQADNSLGGADKDPSAILAVP